MGIKVGQVETEVEVKVGVKDGKVDIRTEELQAKLLV